MISDVIREADSWRYAAAIVSVVVLFLLSVGLRIHGDRVSLPWRVVLWAVVFQQAVTAYVTVVRAQATPPRFPDQTVDLALVGIVVSAVALLVAVVGVFIAEHDDHGPGAA